MRLSIIGTGHVGLVSAACFAHDGHDVLGIDQDRDKIDQIQRGQVPFQEPGLQELVREQIESGRLTFSTDPHAASTHGEVAFVCVGTPSKPSGEADLTYIEAAAMALAESLGDYMLLAEKSTVPVGTGDWLGSVVADHINGNGELEIASNPEFLQEGTAVRDTLEPTRIIVGTSSQRAADLLRTIYQPTVDRAGCQFIATDMATAELVKHASNAFLATKISFINQVADVCERTGANVEVVAMAMGLDPRIAPQFLRAGLGYGGACLPKDVRAFRYRASELGVDVPMLEATDQVNASRRSMFVERIADAVGGLEGKRIALWGLAFKPNTDDLRQAPSLEIAERLSEAGAQIVAYDPVVMDEAAKLLPDVSFVPDLYEAADGADAIAIITEWEQFVEADLDRVHKAMAAPVIVDGRNMFDPVVMEARGFRYLSVGRATVGGSPEP